MKLAGIDRMRESTALLKRSIYQSGAGVSSALRYKRYSAVSTNYTVRYVSLGNRIPEWSNLRG